MRRHFSFQRFAIVVAWAALSPQCNLLVQSWTGLFLPGATVSDAAGVAPDFEGRLDWSSDRPGTVVQNSGAEKPVAERPVAESPKTEETAADRLLSTLSVDTQRAPNLPGVVMR